MLSYLIRRFMIALGTVWAISVLAFVIIQHPPGDYVISYIAQLEAAGDMVTDQEAENLKRQYGLDQPLAMQRVIEILRSIPTIPLWMGLAAAMPRDWSILRVYFAITIILSLIGWTELARVVRGRFLALREEDFVKAGRVIGARRKRIIFRHMLPSFYSHIIAATTVTIPTMIISETALSFLGLGLRPPAVSWGVLLQQAQNVQSVALSPWLMIPAIPVIIAVLAFNFVGDLRDAADPYDH